MAAKSKKPEKAKAKTVKKDHLTESRKFYENIGKTAGSTPPASEGTGIGDECDGDTIDREAAAFVAEDALAPVEPQALTLPLLTDNATLFIQGVQQLTAQLLGTPECAPLLVKVNEWIDQLGKVKKLIVGNDDAIEGLKKLVIEQGQPWGEKGSKQLILAGAIVKVKAVNHRDPETPLTINDLDAGKVEAYFRGAAAEPEKTLPSYMRMVPTWTLKDLSPAQQTNLAKMLADPGEWGQGLRQCLKDTKYQMMAPEMEGA